jgi:hypothetical protein
MVSGNQHQYYNQQNDSWKAGFFACLFLFFCP